MKIKILSWNIWRGKYLPDVIKFLKTADADIIGLQEVIEEKNGQEENHAQVIAKETGYNFVYYPAFTTDRHETIYDLGNAIFTRFDIKNSKCHFLSTLKDYKGNGETEPRITVEVKLKINKRLIKIFNVHLAYAFDNTFKHSGMRDKQVKELLNIISDSNSILLGDFNCPSDFEEIKKISKVIQNTDRKQNNPTAYLYKKEGSNITKSKPEYRIDNIFASHNIKVIKFNVEDSKASDHLPISAILEI